MRYNRRSNRFDNYREITARFDSVATACGSTAPGGHAIKTGDRIGYLPGRALTMCSDCWARWVAENREADAIEAGYMPQCM
jgi:hypothetical protein